eukprot:TRINITY_DN34908_c0_g1_i1.p1 TRINITY_DN34908_c0_g1~~TRINITY_DN34908_c0_g1_i1.p1  ORF type:complete len:242 (-),score=43.70 TRINITY_DN34908_c0_g1_i1:236-886(-)
MESKIQGDKDKWWGTLTEKMQQISSRFEEFCKDQGIQGQVEVEEKGNDFDQYCINLKMKFREEEELTQLNAQRQSGGERAVSTVLYLLALQSRTSCPFRIVDEIDQGMDIQNQKKIFLKMLASSGEVDAPQSFLITPKLQPNMIPDLESDHSAVVDIFCVWNGPEGTSQDEMQLLFGEWDAPASQPTPRVPALSQQSSVGASQEDTEDEDSPVLFD